MNSCGGMVVHFSIRGRNGGSFVLVDGVYVEIKECFRWRRLLKRDKKGFQLRYIIANEPFGIYMLGMLQRKQRERLPKNRKVNIRMENVRLEQRFLEEEKQENFLIRVGGIQTAPGN